MNKKLVIGITSLLLFTGAGCKKPVLGGTPTNQPALVVNARDILAGASGFVANAQQQYLAECKANPNQTKCEYINQAVVGINSVIIAEEAYCGWTSGVPSNTPCVPVQNAAQGLQAAINNLNQIITNLKGIIGK